MDAVAAADYRRVLVLERAALQRRQQRVEIGEQDVARLRKLHREAGIEHVARGQALMDEARFGPDMLGDIGEEGDDVVPGLALDLVDARDLELAALAQRGRRALRHDARLPPAPRWRRSRYRARCGICFPAPRWRSSPAGNSAGSWHPCAAGGGLRSVCARRPGQFEIGPQRASAIRGARLARRRAAGPGTGGMFADELLVLHGTLL